MSAVEKTEPRLLAVEFASQQFFTKELFRRENKEFECERAIYERSKSRLPLQKQLRAASKGRGFRPIKSIIATAKRGKD